MNLFARLMQADPDVAGGATGAETPAPSLEDTIAASYDKLMAGDPDETESAAEDTVDDAGEPAAAPAGTRARDANGKFAKAGKVDGGEPAAGATEAVAEVAAETPAPVASKHPEAPKSWSNEERADWDKLPENYRAAAHRREENFHKGIEQYRGKAAYFDSLHEVIAPHAEIFKKYNQTPQENIGNLLGLQQALYSGDENTKLGTLLNIAREIGVNTESLVTALQNPQTQPAQDPRYDALAQQLARQQQMLEQQARAPIESQTQAFLADPKNEFLTVDGVQATMERLLKSGVAETLQQAYDKACKLSDTVTATLDQRKREADAKERAAKETEERKRKADLAAKAQRASSINVRQQGVTTGQPAKKGTLEDTIGATYDKLMSGG